MNSNDVVFNIALSIFIMLASVFLYFLPYLIAAKRNHHNKGSIFVIDLFCGWTGIGWIVALAMACSAVKKTYVA